MKGWHVVLVCVTAVVCVLIAINWKDLTDGWCNERYTDSTGQTHNNWTAC